MTTKESYAQFLKDVRKATGIEAFAADDSGLVSVRVDDAYNLNLQLVEESRRILCFIEVAELPPDAPKAVYRDLLVGGLFGKETAGGYFSVEPETETVIYNYFTDLETALSEVDDFISTIEKILQLCDIWAERIKGNLTEAPAEGAAAESSLPNHMFVRA